MLAILATAGLGQRLVQQGAPTGGSSGMDFPLTRGKIADVRRDYGRKLSIKTRFTDFSVQLSDILEDVELLLTIELPWTSAQYTFDRVSALLVAAT